MIYTVVIRKESFDRSMIRQVTADNQTEAIRKIKDQGFTFVKFENWIYDLALAEEIARVTDSDCSECAEHNQKQNFTITGFYEEDQQGAYAIIYCHNCKEFKSSGDGDFHEYYQIKREENQVWVESNKKCWGCNCEMISDDAYCQTCKPEDYKIGGKSQMKKNIKVRIIEAMKEWDVQRLQSELEAYISSDNEQNLKESFFDDIATEEEMEERLNEISGEMYEEKKITLHSYVDQLVDNTDGKFDSFESCWFTVPAEWAEVKAKVKGYESLQEFLTSYTYDDVDGWLSCAIKEDVLQGCGAGDQNAY